MTQYRTVRTYDTIYVFFEDVLKGVQGLVMDIRLAVSIKREVLSFTYCSYTCTFCFGVHVGNFSLIQKMCDYVQLYFRQSFEHDPYHLIIGIELYTSCNLYSLHYIIWLSLKSVKMSTTLAKYN